MSYTTMSSAMSWTPLPFLNVELGENDGDEILVDRRSASYPVVGTSDETTVNNISHGKTKEELVPILRTLGGSGAKVPINIAVRISAMFRPD